MNYEKEILFILTQVGERGIAVHALAKHVYNSCNTLFAQADYKHVHQYVQQYLLRKSGQPQSLIERVRHGYYRLNTRNSAAARQLMLSFCADEEKSEDSPQPPQQDLSLSLFD